MRRTRFCCDPAHLFLMLTEYIFLSQALLKNIRAEKGRSRLFPGPKRVVLRWWGLNQSPLSWVVAPVAPPDQRIVLLVEVRPTAPHRHVAAIKQLPYSLRETMFALPFAYLYGSYVRVLPRLLHASQPPCTAGHSCAEPSEPESKRVTSGRSTFYFLPSILMPLAECLASFLYGSYVQVMHRLLHDPQPP